MRCWAQRADAYKNHAPGCRWRCFPIDRLHACFHKALRLGKQRDSKTLSGAGAVAEDFSIVGGQFPANFSYERRVTAGAEPLAVRPTTSLIPVRLLVVVGVDTLTPRAVTHVRPIVLIESRSAFQGFFAHIQNEAMLG